MQHIIDVLYLGVTPLLGLAGLAIAVRFVSWLDE